MLETGTPRPEDLHCHHDHRLHWSVPRPVADEPMVGMAWWLRMSCVGRKLPKTAAPQFLEDKEAERAGQDGARDNSPMNTLQLQFTYSLSTARGRLFFTIQAADQSVGHFLSD